jgi:Asp-tRNA(Asn)/Glu-tRNA(Gln) amidotransferase A subunit family amidase
MVLPLNQYRRQINTIPTQTLPLKGRASEQYAGLRHNQPIQRLPSPPMTDALRHSSTCRQLHLLACGEASAAELTDAYLAAIERDNPATRAYLHVDAEGARAAARASDSRRREGRPLGRLDGIPIAIKDSLDVAGMPTTAGLAGRRGRIAATDAGAVARLRGAGAVLLGKTSLDEGSLGAIGRNAIFGDVPNPRDPGRAAGGSSAGSAAAVAAGLCSAALGSDTMGSIRIPAAFCDIYGLRPTLGEVSAAGLWPALPRLDAVGPLTRSIDDLAVLLTQLDGYDPADPRSRRRRVPLALPDWEPTALRSGVLADLAELGTEPAVATAVQAAIDRLGPILGSRHDIRLAEYGLGRLRRAALLMMEAGIAAAASEDLQGISPQLAAMIDYARGRSAVDYARADRQLDAAVVSTRRLFETVDVLLLPTVPMTPPALGADEPAALADFTAFASLAGCPALSLPLGNGIGLQLVGPPGSELRLLELGQVLVARLDLVA